MCYNDVMKILHIPEKGSRCLVLAYEDERCGGWVVKAEYSRKAAALAYAAAMREYSPEKDVRVVRLVSVDA